jgi:hypothetical protein
MDRILRPAMAWIHAKVWNGFVICFLLMTLLQMREMFPEIVKDLEFFCEILPLGMSPTSPCFTGFALNIGCQTKPHLDNNDLKKFCMVVVDRGLTMLEVRS